MYVSKVRDNLTEFRGAYKHVGFERGLPLWTRHKPKTLKIVEIGCYTKKYACEPVSEDV